MSLLIVFPHALGDMILLTPALKAWCAINKPPSIAVQQRFNSTPLDNCPYINNVHRILSDPWQDFGHHNTQVGFPATYHQGLAIAQKNNYEQVLMAHSEGETINYAEMLGVNIKNYKPEIFISTKDKLEAYKFIYETVQNKPFGFTQTESGDPDRSFPTAYAPTWVNTHLDLPVIEAEKVRHLSINSVFQILKEASGIAVPNSVFWSAAGALGKKVNLAYFARGEEDLNRRKYEIHYNQKTPFYDEDFYKSVVYEVEILT
tara:strand:- start:4460 stop:5239 length:780 start_codon:yes stop_codon:yes gene_type:complete